MGRPVVVTVGPLATASATKVAASQKAAVAGTNYLVLNGAAGTSVATSICQSQTAAGAGSLTLNGSVVSSAPTGSAVAYLGQPSRVYITSAANESGITFTVTGTGMNAQGLYGVTETIAGPNASTASSAARFYTVTSITVSAATTGAVTVGSYGTATLDQARRVLITSAGNDSANTFTLVGTDVNGSIITDVVTGANASTASSSLSFKTLTSITTAAAVASTVTVGTNTVADSQWVRLDDYAANSQVAIQCTVSGTVDYTVQSTIDDPDGIENAALRNRPDLVTWVDSADTNVVGASTTKQSNFAYAPVFVKVRLNSGTGTVTTTIRQAYLG